MKYNNVGFNAAWASSVSEEVFIAHEKHTGLTVEQLREAYQLNKKEGTLIKKIEKVEAQTEQTKVAEQARATSVQSVEALKNTLANVNNSAETTDNTSVSAPKVGSKSPNGNKGKNS